MLNFCKVPTFLTSDIVCCRTVHSLEQFISNAVYKPCAGYAVQLGYTIKQFLISHVVSFFLLCFSSQIKKQGTKKKSRQQIFLSSPSSASPFFCSTVLFHDNLFHNTFSPVILGQGPAWWEWESLYIPLSFTKTAHFHRTENAVLVFIGVLFS